MNESTAQHVSSAVWGNKVAEPEPRRPGSVAGSCQELLSVLSMGSISTQGRFSLSGQLPVHFSPLFGGQPV